MYVLTDQGQSSKVLSGFNRAAQKKKELSETIIIGQPIDRINV